MFGVWKAISNLASILKGKKKHIIFIQNGLSSQCYGSKNLCVLYSIHVLTGGWFLTMRYQHIKLAAEIEWKNNSVATETSSPHTQWQHVYK